MVAIIEKSFPLGQIVATPGALMALQQSSQTPLEFLERHKKGDWGVVGQEDWALNDLAIEQGDRLLSAYHTLNGIKIWIITEGDRSVSTVLLPDEY